MQSRNQSHHNESLSNEIEKTLAALEIKLKEKFPVLG